MVVFWLHEAIPSDLYQFLTSRIRTLLKETSIDYMVTSIVIAHLIKKKKVCTK